MRAAMNRARRPFWLPASNYYVLAVAVSAASFFLIWGILHDEGEDTPWVTAGVSSSLLLIGAVGRPGVTLPSRRRRLEGSQRDRDNFGKFVRGVQARNGHTPQNNKIALDKNAAIHGEM